MKIFFDQSLRIELAWWEKLVSVHWNFEIPRSQIVFAEVHEPTWAWTDIRFGGTFIPNMIRAGTFLTKRGREYWLTKHDRPEVLTIELQDHFYKRLVLGFRSKEEIPAELVGYVRV